MLLGLPHHVASFGQLSLRLSFPKKKKNIYLYKMLQTILFQSSEKLKMGGR